FFSSRRRHTRFSRDWSSDVCSSDLILLNERYTESASALEDAEIALIPKENFFELMFNKPAIATKFIKLLSGDIKEKEEQMLGFRSEERRVGKECRSRW